MATTSIEWTQQTWNPVTGCTRASAGCDNCYAVTMTKRLEAMGQTEKYGGLVNPGKRHFNGVVKCHPDDLSIPLRRKKPTVYFVNSMSDLFHEAVPFDFIDKVFAVMALCPQHTFQVLTKRAERMAAYFAHGQDTPTSLRVSYEGVTRDSVRWNATKQGRAWPLPNVWLGVSVEDQEQADGRIPHLLAAPAAVRFLSCEPLLGPVNIRNYVCNCAPCFRGDKCGAGVHWVIVGGESGPKARPMHPNWARSLRDQCQAAGVPFFFKQWGQWENHQNCPAPTEHQTHDWLSCTKLFPDGTQALYGRRDEPGYVFIDKVGKHAAGRELDGRTWDEVPQGKEVLR